MNELMNELMNEKLMWGSLDQGGCPKMEFFKGLTEWKCCYEPLAVI